MPAPKKHPKPKTTPWGIYTLGFLTLAFVMMVVSSSQGTYTVLTFIGLILGLVGAAFCTVKGLKGLRGYRM
jgi:nitrate/nitrite transporter NarK